MATIVTYGDSIEGRKIEGSSRKPVAYKGVILENGKKLHKFIAQFNSKSSISEELTKNDKKIIEKAKTSTEDKIICDDILLRSLDRKYSTEKESNASATHGASSWSFPRQTNVMITKSHKEIEAAVNKRKIENKPKKKIK